MTTNALTAEQREAFYKAAILGLSVLEERERVPRRFGLDADARWALFSGALGAGDRLDILLRDAAGTWGAAFSPADCFGFFGLADDEPFGPDWVSVQDALAKKLLSEVSHGATLEDVAAALGVKLSAIDVPPIAPATKLVVAGGGAIVAVARAFANDGTLSWTDQVVAVAGGGAFRQLAGLAAVLVGGRRRTTLIRPGADYGAEVRAAGFAHIDAVVISPDAEPEASDVARRLGGE